MSAAGVGGIGSSLHLDSLPHHLLHVACDVAVDLEVTDEQDDERNWVDESRSQQTEGIARFS